MRLITHITLAATLCLAGCRSNITSTAERSITTVDTVHHSRQITLIEAKGASSIKALADSAEITVLPDSIVVVRARRISIESHSDIQTSATSNVTRTDSITKATDIQKADYHEDHPWRPSWWQILIIIALLMLAFRQAWPGTRPH